MWGGAPAAHASAAVFTPFVFRFVCYFLFCASIFLLFCQYRSIFVAFLFCDARLFFLHCFYCTSCVSAESVPLCWVRLPGHICLTLGALGRLGARWSRVAAPERAFPPFQLVV